MTKASDNAYPSILITEGTEPSAPAAGKQRLYIDSTTHKLKRTDSSGVDVTIESSGSGDVATDTIWDAAGDLVQGTGANTGAKLTAGTAGMFLKSAGAAAANLWAFPPGYEIDYVQITSDVALTATTEGTSHTVVTGTSIAYDGSTTVLIEFYSPDVRSPSAAGGNATIILLYDGGTLLGRFGVTITAAAGATGMPVRLARRLTPSNASHQYIVKAYGTVNASGQVGAGAGGTGTSLPAFIRITKV